MNTDFSKIRVLVIGDIMLDSFLYCSSNRISPECNVPILLPNEQKYTLGGAANVAKNIRNFGAKVSLVGIIGKDHNSIILKRLFDKAEIGAELIIEKEEEVTTLKERLFSNDIPIARIDKEKTLNIKSYFKSITSNILNIIDDIDIIILSDYEKGMLSKDLCNFIVSLANKKNKMVFIDPKKEDFSSYKNANYITPNLAEIKKALGCDNNFEQILEKSKKLSTKLNSKLLITKSEKGLSLISSNDSSIHIDGMEINDPDVTGAGDTVVASFSLSIFNKNTEHDSMIFANTAASLVVQKNGTSVVTTDEILDVINEK